MVGDGPSRATVRRVATNVFERGEFQRKLSWLERFLRWLGRLFHVGNVQVGSDGTSSGGSSLVLYLVLIVVVALLIWIIVRVARTWVRTPKPASETDDEPELDVPKTQHEWRSDAEAAEAAGRWKDAIRARYRELVAELVDRHVVDGVPGRTTGELRGDIAAHAPGVSADFSEATLLFELPWYADVDTGLNENARFKELAAVVLAGAPANDPRRRSNSELVPS